MTLFAPEIFPYQKLRGQSYPIVSAFVQTKANQPNIRIWALVDSGASMSIFQPEVATLLGINIDKGKLINLEGVGGVINGYVHTLSLQISHKTIVCPIVFSKEYKVSINLFGRSGFFDNFKITFDERKKQVELI